jgi:DNA transformation protein and related proteins
MAAGSALLDYLLDQLAPLGQVRGRTMFGGHGLYLNGAFVGIVEDETLYLKVDDRNRPAYEAEGMGPFVYVSKGRRVALSYWEVPADAIEEAEQLCDWVMQAAAAARRAQDKKSRPKSKLPGGGGTRSRKTATSTRPAPGPKSRRRSSP